MTPPPNFLRDIALYYTSRRDVQPKFDTLAFVLPNKRSAMFLKKHVRDCLKEPTMMPRFMTMRTFISLNSPYPEANEREQLFILYDAYLEALHAKGRRESAREFDNFIFWGDMMLSDFNDIDCAMANAADLFKNLKNVKEIQADYLDADQKEVIRRIWGESRLTSRADEFWLHLDDETESSLGAKFVYLWEILGDVYSGFQRELERRKLATAGSQTRAAVRRFKELSPLDISGDTHYVFIGFNDLNTAETLIFDRLKDLGIASFFWDTAPLELAGYLSGSPGARPLRRLAELARHFPMPQDFVIRQRSTPPQIEVIGVPSNVGQAKAMGDSLEKLMAENAIDSSNPLSTAVVMPDAGLLMPALFSIPESIEAINISLGLPYRSTTFASLLRAIISMQLRARTIHGSTHFYFEDVNAVLTHPHIQLIAPEVAQKLTELIASERLYNLSASRILETVPELKAVFTAVRDLENAGDVGAYLTEMLDWLMAAIDEISGGTNRFETMAIDFFKKEIEALTALIESHGVQMSERTFLHLFERMFSSRALTVNGTPLRGMQVLGVLETRCLDFDNVAILSMNEKIFPRKQYTKTMIPNNLRLGFGLPDFDSLEWTYAYCFYRLMARAERVALFYDTRSEALGGGEISRYISQMRYLMPKLDISVRNLLPGAVPDDSRTITVCKNATVLSKLDQLKAGGPLRLSASALKTYKKCPLQFYLQYVRRMRGSDELVDYISASDYGTMVHNTIQSLYEPYRGSLVNADILSHLLSPENKTIERTARQQMVSMCYPAYAADDTIPLPAEGELGCEIISAIVRADLIAERDCYCRPDFTFIDNELKIDRPVWRIDNELAVNFYMSIDRVDRIDGTKLRFIDFKTGSESTSAKLAELFDGAKHEKDGIFQLLTYCEAYAAMVDSAPDITPMLHPMRALAQKPEITQIVLDGLPLETYKQVSEAFRPMLHAMIKEIFDPEVPFTQCADSKRCKFCPFLTLCGSVVPEF